MNGCVVYCAPRFFELTLGYQKSNKFKYLYRNYYKLILLFYTLQCVIKAYFLVFLNSIFVDSENNVTISQKHNLPKTLTNTFYCYSLIKCLLDNFKLSPQFAQKQKIKFTQALQNPTARASKN